MSKIDITGNTFGKLIAIRDIGSSKYGRKWECLCECGKTIFVTTGALRCGNTKSCGCSKRKPRTNFKQGQGGFNILYADYKKSARTRNLEFKLSKDVFKKLTKRNCFYCGQIPKTSIKPSKKSSEETRKLGEYIYNGIDRKDNDVGYTVENCITCCETCNRLKRATHYEDFIYHIRKIANNLMEIDV